MDMELFRHIDQMLKAQYPTLFEGERLQHAKDVYQIEPQRLQSLGESERFQERLRRMLDLSRNARPEIRHTKPQIRNTRRLF